MCIGFYFEYGDWESVALQCIYRWIEMGAECGMVTLPPLDLYAASRRERLLLTKEGEKMMDAR